MSDDPAVQSVTDRLLAAGLTEAAQALRLALYEVETCTARAERLLARYEERRGLPPAHLTAVHTPTVPAEHTEVFEMTATDGHRARLHITVTNDGRTLTAWEKIT